MRIERDREALFVIAGFGKIRFHILQGSDLVTRANSFKDLILRVLGILCQDSAIGAQEEVKFRKSP
jgi:hypothetical protein